MSDYDAAMKYLNEQIGSSKIDYNIHHATSLHND